MYPSNQPANVIPAIFDPTRPPPPLPPHIQVINGARKRLNSEKAGPSKVRRVHAAHCKQCDHLESRIHLYKEQYTTLQYEEETKNLILQKKITECELMKSILKSNISPELFEILENCVEEPPSMPQIKDVFSCRKSETSISLSDKATLSQSISSLLRFIKSANFSTDLLYTLLETLDNERSQESRSKEAMNPVVNIPLSANVSNNAANEYRGYQQTDHTSLPSSNINISYGTAASSLYPGVGVPGRSGLTQMPASAPYYPTLPHVQPSTSLQSNLPMTSTPNVSYNGQTTMSMPLPTAWPSTSFPPHVNSNGLNVNVYAQTNYYPVDQ